VLDYKEMLDDSLRRAELSPRENLEDAISRVEEVKTLLISLSDSCILFFPIFADMLKKLERKCEKTVPIIKQALYDITRDDS
jgi:hypothetical protein